MGESSWQSPSLYRKVPGLEWRLEAWNRIVLFCFSGVLLVSLIWQAQAWFDCRLENLSAICAMDYCLLNIKVHGYFRLCNHVNPRGARNRDDVLNHDSNSDSVFKTRKSVNIHGKELRSLENGNCIHVKDRSKVSSSIFHLYLTLQIFVKLPLFGRVSFCLYFRFLVKGNPAVSDVSNDYCASDL